MQPTLPFDPRLLTPLVMILVATAPGESVALVTLDRRAPRPSLVPGERVLAVVRPDPAILAMLAGLAAVLLVSAAVLLRLLTGADPAALSLALVPVGLAGAALARDESARGWCVTNRRIVTRQGATLWLSDLRRIAVGPLFLGLDGPDRQALHLCGLRDAPNLARGLAALCPLARAPPHPR